MGGGARRGSRACYSEYMQDLGSSEIFPGVIKHNANGRFVAVLGDGEYIIYTALAWRNKSFGSAADFAWSTEQNDFATREGGSSTVKLHKNFKACPLPPLPPGVLREFRHTNSQHTTARIARVKTSRVHSGSALKAVPRNRVWWFLGVLLRFSTGAGGGHDRPRLHA